MATPPPADILDAIVSPDTQITRRIEIYEQDGETLWAAIDQTKSRLTDGTISVDGTRDERRSLDITFENTDGLLRPNPRDGFWYDKIIVPYRGVQTRTSSWEISLGRFMIDNISAPSFPHTVKVVGRDYTKKLMLSKFVDSVTFDAGYVLEQLVMAIAGNAGITKFRFPNEGVITGTDYSFDQASDRWTAVKQMATDYNYELFFDNDGYMVMRQYLDPTTSPVILRLDTGANGNLVDFELEVDDSNLFNHILVIGGSADGTTVPPYAEAINTLPNSPTSVDEIGDRLNTYTSAGLSTVDQCKLLADRMLSLQALESYSMNTDSIVFPWLDGNDIVEIIDPSADIQDPIRYLFGSFTVPLGLAAMSGSAKRITVVGSGTA